MAAETLHHSGASGEALTTANSGYGSVSTVGGSATFTDAWTIRNTNTIDMIGTTTPGYVSASHDIAPTDTLAYSLPFQPIDFPTSESGLLWFGNDETRQLAVGFLSSQKIIVRDGPGSNASLWQSPVLTANTKYIFSIYFTRHATAGTMRAVIYAEDEKTIIADSGLLTGKNTGTAPITRIKVSAKSAVSSVIPARYRMGRPRWDAAATGIMPAWTQHQPMYYPVGGQWQPEVLYFPLNGVWVPFTTE